VTAWANRWPLKPTAELSGLRKDLKQRLLITENRQLVHDIGKQDEPALHLFG